jgi:photosystem II stability/assembly factor-like uncharacterized protein
MQGTNQRWASVAGLIGMMAALSASPALAGVDRWTTSWPTDAYATCLAIDPISPNVVYAGSLDRVFTSFNDGMSWSNSSTVVEGVNAVTSLAIDPGTPSNIFAGTSSHKPDHTSGAVFESTDRGATWTSRLTAQGIYNLVFDSQHAIYAADYDDASYYYFPKNSSIYKSVDGGKTWSGQTTGFHVSPGTLMIDPRAPSTLYFAESRGGGIRKSVDGGSHWSSPGTGLNELVSALALDPGNPNILYAASGNGIYKSFDAGTTFVFESGSAGLEVSALAVDPRNTNTVYAGTYNAGVFRSSDGGRNWRDFNNGLTSLSVSSLVIDRTGTGLHIVSGNVVFDYQLFSGAVDVTVGNDNTASLLLTDPDGHLALKTLDNSGNITTSMGSGPFIGWYPTALANDTDGLAHVLWNNPNGSAAVWLVGPSGIQASYLLRGAQGWIAGDVAAAGGGLTHVLWTNTDGRIAIVEIDKTGNLSDRHALGPYPRWTALAISDGADGLSRLLWKKDDGSTGLSLVGSEGLQTTYRFAADSSGLTPLDVAVAADGQARILFTHLDGRVSLWRVDNAGVATQGPVYAPPSGGFTARHIAVGPDGLARVLWTGADSTGLVWLMSAEGVFQQSFPVGAN